MIKNCTTCKHSFMYNGTGEFCVGRCVGTGNYPKWEPIESEEEQKVINDVERNLLNLKNSWAYLKKMGAIGIHENNSGVIEVHCRGRKAPLFNQIQGEETDKCVRTSTGRYTEVAKDAFGLRVFYIYQDPEGGE